MLSRYHEPHKSNNKAISSFSYSYQLSVATKFCETNKQKASVAYSSKQVFSPQVCKCDGLAWAQPENSCSVSDELTCTSEALLAASSGLVHLDWLEELSCASCISHLPPAGYTSCYHGKGRGVKALTYYPTALSSPLFIRPANFPMADLCG